jgi:hypothetical protein
MTTSIKSIAEIPAWFDIKKYARAKELGLCEWAVQLGARSGLYDLLEGQKGQEWRQDKRALEYIECYLNAIKQDPILLTYGPYVPLVAWPSKIPSIPEPPFNRSTVKSLTICEACLISHNFTTNPFKPMLEAWRASMNLYATAEQEALISRPYDLFPQEQNLERIGLNYHVVMDLSAPDEQILSDCRHWLTHFREIINSKAPKANFTKRDCEDWHESGVLPYLDLTLWTRYEGVHITQNILGEAIFPDESTVDTTNRIRLTTRTKVQKIMKSDVINALMKQAEALENYSIEEK